jgi:hypothetical protein
MATAIPRYQARLGVSEQPRHLFAVQLPQFWMKRTVVITLLFGTLTFAGALYYVEQHVRLRTLNYEIIALKQRKKELIEQQKTLQLQLDQLKRLDVIEADMLKKGFVPVEEGQIRIISPEHP